MDGIPGAARQASARRFVHWPLVVMLVVMMMAAAVPAAEAGQSSSQQTRREAPAAGSPWRGAERAWLLGRLDDVDARSSDLTSEQALVLRARTLAARGEYAQAGRLLEPAAAREPLGQAALELGLLSLRVGRRAEAAERLLPLVGAARRMTDPAELTRAARAARALGRLREANGLFREAAGAAPDDPDVQTAWGELFLETYNRQEAVRSFQTALKAEPDWIPALYGLARGLAEDNPPAAVRTAGQILELNPRWVPAHVLRADLALDRGRRDEAEAAIARALEINPHSLEALSLRAAIAYLEDRTGEFEAQAARLLAINPVYGELFRVTGGLLARNYRFDEAVELLRRGLELDPSSSRLHADLGLHLLRTGDEDEARVALEHSFRDDPYDVVTYNLLELLDTLDQFETFQVGDVHLRLHPDEAGVLREYAIPLIEEAFEDLTRRYGMTPRGPILVEVFPRHDDFAVRNLGLPGMVGAVGACFGRVITMDSPRARPPGSFNWAATLWHEIAHVITLQMSQQRVPRWLTEGVSVYEERLAREAWGREMELPFVRALDRGEVLPLRELNSGFTNPQTIALAYHQSSLVVEHIVATYGDDALHRMLRAYGEGKETETVLREVLGLDYEGLQAGFDRMLEERYTELRSVLRAPQGLSGAGSDAAALRRLAEAHPESYPVRLRLGQALMAAGRGAEAVQALEAARALVPHATGLESPGGLLADLALERGDAEEAMRQLEALLARDHTGMETARRLAELAERRGDETRQWTAYTRIVELDPFDAATLSARGRLALARGDAVLAGRDFRAALAAGPLDRAEAHSDLAESYLMQERLADARRQAIAALEIAPAYERAQELLLRSLEGQP